MGLLFSKRAMCVLGGKMFFSCGFNFFSFNLVQVIASIIITICSLHIPLLLQLWAKKNRAWLTIISQEISLIRIAMSPFFTSSYTLHKWHDSSNPVYYVMQVSEGMWTGVEAVEEKIASLGGTSKFLWSWHLSNQSSCLKCSRWVDMRKACMITLPASKVDK